MDKANKSQTSSHLFKAVLPRRRDDRHEVLCDCLCRAVREPGCDVGRAALAHDVSGRAPHVLVVVRPEVVTHLVGEGHGAVAAAGRDLNEVKGQNQNTIY